MNMMERTKAPGANCPPRRMNFDVHASLCIIFYTVVINFPKIKTQLLLFYHKLFRKDGWFKHLVFWAIDVKTMSSGETLRGGSLLVLMLVLVQILVLLGVLVSSPSLFTTVR